MYFVFIYVYGCVIALFFYIPSTATIYEMYLISIFFEKQLTVGNKLQKRLSRTLTSYNFTSLDEILLF